MLFGTDFIFRRADLAKQFDLHSAVFIPTTDGVIEVGSMQQLADPATILPLEIIMAIREGSKLPAIASTTIPSPDRCSDFLKELVEHSDWQTDIKFVESKRG